MMCVYVVVGVSVCVMRNVTVILATVLRGAMVRKIASLLNSLREKNSYKIFLSGKVLAYIAKDRIIYRKKENIFEHLLCF